MQAACAALLITAGCGQDEPRHAVPAKVTDRERDSVIAQCRKLLLGRPDDAALHNLLGRTLLEQSLAKFRRNGGAFGINSFAYGVTLNDAGRPLDNLSADWTLARTREIASHLGTALRLDPRSASSLEGLAQLDFTIAANGLADSLYDTAAVLYVRALAIDSTSLEAYNGLAKCSMARHRDTQALAALQTAIAHDSTSGSTYLTMGNAYADSGNIPVAFACYDNAVRLGLASPGEYLDIAREYMDAQREGRLLGRLAYLRVEGPRFVRSIVRGALKMLGMYHPGIAMRLTGMALQADSANAEAHLLRATIEVDEGDTAAAIDELSAALLCGNAPYTSYWRFPLELLQDAARTVPDKPQILLLLGPVTQRWRGASAAVPYLRDAVTQLPGNAAARYLLGTARLAQGDTAGARALFDAALSFPVSAYPIVYWDIGAKCSAAGDSAGALRSAERQMEASGPIWIAQLFEQEPQCRRYAKSVVRKAAAYCMAGYQCSWAAGGWRGERIQHMAIGFFEHAHALAPASGIPYLGLGDLFIDDGNQTEALRYYRLAAERGSKDAAEKVKRFEGAK